MRSFGWLSICFCLTVAMVACPVAPPGNEPVAEKGVGDGSVGKEAKEPPPAEPRAAKEQPESPDAGAQDGKGQEKVAEQGPERKAPIQGIPALQKPAISVPVSEPGIVQIQPSLAVGADGSLAMSYTASGGESKLGIFFVLLDADGKARASHTRLDTYKGGNKTESNTCALKGGGYVTAWSMDTGNFDPKLGNLQIRFRLIDAQGHPQGTESVEVRTDKDGNHWLVKVACLASGGFAIAGVFPDDKTSFGTFVQRFDAKGKAVGKAAQANTTTTDGNQAYPGIAAAPDGTVAVVWEQGDKGEKAYMRLFPTSGAPSQEIAIPTNTTSSTRPSVSIDPDSGQILVATRHSTGAFKIHQYAKDGTSATALTLDDPANTLFTQPTLLALGKGIHAIAYLKGPNNNSVSPSLAILGPKEATQPGFSITTGRIPHPYRPGLAFIKDKGLYVAYTERTQVKNGFAVKLAHFRY